uniref:ATP synthase F0 subunit 8 n=1 Tax=Cybister brevis TaxID=398584 RepID=UPI0022FD8B35|nr:ATP synthase F0 subunit 8 [Cybister brevis]WBP62296.1 ATP synthase F0 subunit 8 [Cybister brevis]
MPQMAPMSWLLLYIFFSLIFIIINILNYYNFLKYPSQENQTIKIKTNKLNWKW